MCVNEIFPDQDSHHIKVYEAKMGQDVALAGQYSVSAVWSFIQALIFDILYYSPSALLENFHLKVSPRELVSSFFFFFLVSW